MKSTLNLILCNISFIIIIYYNFNKINTNNLKILSIVSQKKTPNKINVLKKLKHLKGIIHVFDFN